jgi:hypothetical protein
MNQSISSTASNDDHNLRHWDSNWRHNLMTRCQQLLVNIPDVYQYIVTINVMHNADRYFQAHPVVDCNSYIRIGMHIFVLWLKMHEDNFPFRLYFSQVLPHLLNVENCQVRRTPMFDSRSSFALSKMYRFNMRDKKLSFLQVELELLETLNYELEEAPLVAMCARRFLGDKHRNTPAWEWQEKWNWLLLLLFLRVDIMQIPLPELSEQLNQWYFQHQNTSHHQWHMLLDEWAARCRKEDTIMLRTSTFNLDDDVDLTCKEEYDM